MKIYTRTGDRGETSLLGGVRVGKDDLTVEAFGTVDELNAGLGLARSMVLPDVIDEVIGRIQHQLFDLGAELAAGETERDLPKIGQRQIDALERAIDEFDATLPQLVNFILPSGNPVACQLHVCRSVCRRAERCTVRLERQRSQDVGSAVVYLNRLSDLLFVLARAANHSAGESEFLWQAGQ